MAKVAHALTHVNVHSHTHTHTHIQLLNVSARGSQKANYTLQQWQQQQLTFEAQSKGSYCWISFINRVLRKHRSVTKEKGMKI